MTNDRHAPDRRDFLQQLRQSRQFLDKPVPQEIVDELIAVARNTGGEQTDSIRFLVIDDLATKQALSEIGTFTEFLAHVAVVIVIEGTTTPGKANVEKRMADRIMLTASRHRLGSGTGWFGPNEDQRAARAILGVGPDRHVWAAVGFGYVDESTTEGSTSLERIRKSLDALTAKRPKLPE